MEIFLPPSAELNLEGDEEIIEEVPKEADGIEAPMQSEQEERGSTPPHGRSKTPASRLRQPTFSSDETFVEVRNPFQEQIYPPSPSKPQLFSESSP